MKTQTAAAAMNPSTPKTAPPSSTRLRKAVFGGFQVILVAIAVCLGLEPAKAQDSTEANARLQRVKVAALYENVTDNVPGRSLADTIRIFRETHTGLVFRGFWAEWFPTPDSPDNIAPELRDFLAERGKLDSAQVPAVIRREGFYYDRLRDHIAAIKREMPNLIFIGSFPAQRITRVARNPITGKMFSADETWRIALGPEKWRLQREGKPITKEDFQTGIARSGWTTDQSRDDPRKLEAYFPDITHPEFQELLLSWAKKQIDCGADGVWIDGLEAQPFFLSMITDDPDHPAVKESLAACAKVVDAIHRYGQAKGKHVYVASWARPHGAYLFRKHAGSWDDAFAHIERWSVPPPQLDFVTLGPLNEEVLAQTLDQPKWDREMVSVHKVHGDTPVFAFLDWAFNESQTVFFSQKLSKAEQRQLLKTLDAAYAKMGVNFIYPVHGGYMGRGPLTTKLAFGTQRSYDSLAPEFDTYETIRALAQKKTEGGQWRDGFVPLFNGKNLDGWQGATDVYAVEDGNLVCQKHGPGEKESTEKNLFTTKEYADFILRFDFKLEPGANNGVAVRSPLEGRISTVGMEIQILDDDAEQYKNLQPHQYHGSIYLLAPAKRGHLKPAGQWNTEEIRFQGRHAKITLNGVVIVDVDLDNLEYRKYLDKNTGHKRAKGYIGFLGHGSRVEFRNLKIHPLPAKERK